MVERRLQKQDDDRERHASHVIAAVQELQNSLRNYEEYISGVNKRMEKVEDLISRVVILMEGTMGRTGMVGEQAERETRLKNTEKKVDALYGWKAEQKRLVVILAAIFTAIGSAATWVFDHFVGR
jgi:hypothetical protein